MNQSDIPIPKVDCNSPMFLSYIQFKTNYMAPDITIKQFKEVEDKKKKRKIDTKEFKEEINIRSEERAIELIKISDQIYANSSDLIDFTNC